MRKCGFHDCNNQIKWKEEACEECHYRKENHTCDACLQPAGYNLLLLGNGFLRDFINDTEIMLQRTRKMFDKVPFRLHNLLREMEQSLILTEEENQAIVKKHCLRMDFLRKKRGKKQRDNVHLIKLCRKCLDELAEEEEEFTETNSDVKKIAEKWAKNGKRHLQILEEIDGEIGRKRYDKIMEELEQEVKEEVPEEGQEESPTKNDNKKNQQSKEVILFGTVIFLAVIAVLIFVIRKRRKKSR